MLFDDRAKLAVVGRGKRLHRLLHCGHQRSHHVAHDFLDVAADVTALRLHIGIHHARHHHLELFVPSAAFLLLLEELFLLLTLFGKLTFVLRLAQPRFRLDEAALLHEHIDEREHHQPRKRAGNDGINGIAQSEEREK